MDIRPPSAEFVTVIEDSRRWQGFVHRDDDIVIATPPKCGTTWMQTIVWSLLWPGGDAPGTRPELSPWIDMRAAPLDDLLSKLDDQTHRRFIKTHSPVDTIPMASDGVRYIGVYRSPADALVSWGNHRAKMKPEIMVALNLMAAEDGLAALPARFDGDYDHLLEEWMSFCSPVVHLAGLWPLKERDNVLLVHYADLTADLSEEMRRVASFLGLEIDEARWEETVERCRFDSMRQQAVRSSGYAHSFDGGAESFFYRGGNGRGIRLLNEQQLARCRAHSEELLTPDAVEWLEHGNQTSVS